MALSSAESRGTGLACNLSKRWGDPYRKTMPHRRNIGTRGIILHDRRL
jgi:hypothetical protein